MATRHRRTVGQSSKSRQVRQRRGHSLEGRRQAPSRAQVVFVYLFLSAITWLVFGQTVRHEFVNFDDHVYVYDNPLVAGGLNINGIVSAFTHPHARNWHPLTTVSHMLDCQLYGLNAGGHHFTSVALHIIAVLLLFRVLQVTTGALWPSAFVAALFAIHPLHVESVAWVSERKDVLSTVFFMLTLAAYVRYVRATSPGRYFFVAMIFALGLMSKPMLVTAPFVLLLLDYWPLRRFDKGTQFTGRGIASWLKQRPGYQQLFLEKTPLLIFSGLSGLLPLWPKVQVKGSSGRLLFPCGFKNPVVATSNMCGRHSGRRAWRFSILIRITSCRSGKLPWRRRCCSLFLRWQFFCGRSGLTSLLDGSGMSACWSLSSESFRLASKDMPIVIPTCLTLVCFY